MPVSKLKLSFIQPLVDGREDIVDEFNSVVGGDYLNHFFISNWNLLTLHYAEVGKTDNCQYFPTVGKFVDNLPDNIEISFLGVSVIKHGDTAFHQEYWTKVKGYYRIHIPLLNIDGASIDVIEDDGETHNYTYELGNAYQFENPYNMHKPSNYNKDTRLMLMLDFVDTNENPNISVEELYSKYTSAHQEFTTPPI
jgi:hypothetical protein